RAVRAAKYPPRGVRGYCFSRMNAWGADFDAYAAAANEETAVVVMIESKEGVANIDAILAVDGVDGVLIGPYDLSGSYGVPGQTGHAEVAAGCRRVREACAAAGKAAGLHVVKPDADAVDRALAEGYTFLVLGVDIVFLAEGARRSRALAEKGGA
ncbi:MAG: aldolase/citrate lyase family protein, partial [Planctomycetota bacterium]